MGVKFYTTFVNLTGHDITVVDDEGEEILYLPYEYNGRAQYRLSHTPQGSLLTETRRYNEDDTYKDVDVQVPIVHASFNDITGLPDPKHGTMYVVPYRVAQSVNRHDVLYVDGKEVKRFFRC